jgi:hypothetical protein
VHVVDPVPAPASATAAPDEHDGRRRRAVSPHGPANHGGSQGFVTERRGLSPRARRILVSLSALVIVIVAAVITINFAGSGTDDTKGEPPPMTHQDGTPVTPLERAYVELQQAITP